ncbi:MAG: Regulatory protein RecX [Gemmatimonadaceae bacterium]|nr:Regulatory protein RecX [Gemmatimonadaceae bacterium]
METITGISEANDGSGRFLISVDGRELGLLSAGALSELGLRGGDALDARSSDALRDAVATQAVFDKAVELLRARQRSTRELQRRLVQKGAGRMHVVAAIDRLVALGYLDDAAYAESIVQSQLVEGGSSRRRVQQDLLKRGVERAVVADAIQRAVDENGSDEAATALDLARGRLRTMRSLEAEARRRRLYGFLTRRGYDPDVIASVMRALRSEISSTGEDGPDDPAQ